MQLVAHSAARHELGVHQIVREPEGDALHQQNSTDQKPALCHHTRNVGSELKVFIDERLDAEGV
jgi:hypothetical protein